MIQVNFNEMMSCLVAEIRLCGAELPPVLQPQHLPNFVHIGLLRLHGLVNPAVLQRVRGHQWAWPRPQWSQMGMHPYVKQSLCWQNLCI